MEDPLSSARRWVRGVVRSEIVASLLLALWHVFLCLGACFIWFFVMVGAYLALMWVIAASGLPVLSPDILGFGVLGLQLLCTPWLARTQKPRWTFAVSADETEIVAIPPERWRKLAIYDQDHDLSFRRMLAAIFLAAPIALANAWHDVTRALELRHLKIEPAARLAAELVQRQEKVTLKELAESWQDEGLLDALETAAELPGFQIFSQDPQGVALTAPAVDAYLAV